MQTAPEIPRPSREPINRYPIKVTLIIRDNAAANQVTLRRVAPRPANPPPVPERQSLQRRNGPGGLEPLPRTLILTLCCNCTTGPRNTSRSQIFPQPAHVTSDLAPPTKIRNHRRGRDGLGNPRRRGSKSFAVYILTSKSFVMRILRRISRQTDDSKDFKGMGGWGGVDPLQNGNADRRLKSVSLFFLAA